jgi:hypothetical protein
MFIKKLIFYLCLTTTTIQTKAQTNTNDVIDDLYKLTIKELRQPPKYESRWSFGSSYLCKGNLASIVQCLLNAERGRIKIKGQMPEKYFDLQLSEPNPIGLQQVLASGGRSSKVDTLSLVHTAIALLEQTYHFKVTSIVDTVEVWCLQVADSTKLLRYDEREGNERYAGPNFDTNDWESVGMELYYLCSVVASKANVMVYDETNETGRFTFIKPTIPMGYMKDFAAINHFLETQYGLHFIKRKQVEPLKLIEFR